uniref:Cupin domain-containing protein n=1 Tax=Heterorhabditis bacteriophora TaxID=37862 RepID=A0A1I7XH50_HETBA
MTVPMDEFSRHGSQMSRESYPRKTITVKAGSRHEIIRETDRVRAVAKVQLLHIIQNIFYMETEQYSKTISYQLTLLKLC